MKVIISGSSGFVGSHLYKTLSERGIEVVTLSRYKQDEFNCNSISYDEFLAESFKFIEGVTAFCHIAGAAHRKFSNNEVFESNDKLTFQLVNKVMQLGIEQFIYLSSANLYSEQHHKITLETPIVSHGSNLVLSKIRCEKIIKRCLHNSNVKYVIIRSPLVYGPGVTANFASLIKLVSKGFPLPFSCIKDNKRSLVSAKNLVDLIITCIGNPKTSGQIFLVSDGHDVSTSEMVSLIAKNLSAFGWQLPLPKWLFKAVGKMTGKNDVVQRLLGSLQLDITHTKETLNWSPPQTMEQGFKETAQHFLNTKNK